MNSESKNEKIEIAPSSGLFQNGKRCGIILVSKESGRDNLNWRDHTAMASTIWKFLVVKGKTSGIWSLPKGRTSSEDETEEECAIRETKEETGINIDTVKNLPRIVLGRNVYFILHCNSHDYNKFIVFDNYEVDEVCWKTIDELRHLTCNKDLRAILRYPDQVQGFHKLIFQQKMFPQTKKYYWNTNRKQQNWTLISA